MAAALPASGTDMARRRDARVFWLLDMHPVTAEMLARLGWFPSKAKALKRLRVLARRRRVKQVGTVSRHAGRPEHVWCRWRPKHDQLLHEVELTDVCLRLHAERIVRGPHVTDSEVRPDAQLWIGGACYYLEIDRGTSAYSRIAARFRAYERCPHLSLWVCPTEARRDGLRERAGALRRTALFATSADVLASPHGPVWLDHAGQRAALPRHGG